MNVGKGLRPLFFWLASHGSSQSRFRTYGTEGFPVSCLLPTSGPSGTEQCHRQAVERTTDRHRWAQMPPTQGLHLCPSVFICGWTLSISSDSIWSLWDRLQIHRQAVERTTDRHRWTQMVIHPRPFSVSTVFHLWLDFKHFFHQHLVPLGPNTMPPASGRKNHR
jgi:hypothetical protein